MLYFMSPWKNDGGGGNNNKSHQRGARGSSERQPKRAPLSGEYIMFGASRAREPGSREKEIRTSQVKYIII